MRRPIYVLDTNVLVDYPDIVPPVEEEGEGIRESTVDFSNVHIVIPTAVVRELSSFKREKSERGKVARKVLKRLRKYTEKLSRPMGMSYQMSMPTSITKDDVWLSILPVHKNFQLSLPFSPSDEDMDGQIILAVLTVAFLKAGLAIDGTADASRVLELETHLMDITLLTNDNGLAIRARERGIKTSRYGYLMPEPYTGRRNVMVTPDAFSYFFSEGKIEREIWELMVPSEQGRKLVANEFIVMHLSNPDDYPQQFWLEENSNFSHVARYDVTEDALVALRYASKFPSKLRNVGQAIYAESLMDPQIAAVICTGPAGSGKTYMATVYGYNACKRGDFIGVTVVPCESQSRIGALPGDLNDKMDPEVQPLKNALRNYLLKSDKWFREELNRMRRYGTIEPCPADSRTTNGEADDERSLKERLDDHINQIWNSWFSNLPIENARGRDFSYELAIYDEFQDQNQAQADTLVKRLGTDGKIVLTGDYEQIHAPYLDSSNNGLAYASRLLFDHPMVAQVHFIEEEVIRHPLVKTVAERQRAEHSARLLSSAEVAPDVVLR